MRVRSTRFFRRLSPPAARPGLAARRQFAWCLRVAGFGKAPVLGGMTSGGPLTIFDLGRSIGLHDPDGAENRGEDVGVAVIGRLRRRPDADREAEQASGQERATQVKQRSGHE